MLVTNRRGDQTIATNLKPDLVLELDALCHERGVTRSALVRALIERELGGHMRCTQCGFIINLSFEAEFPDVVK